MHKTANLRMQKTASMNPKPLTNNHFPETVSYLSLCTACIVPARFVAVGWLIIAMGAAFLLLGLPLLIPHVELWILLSIPFVMLTVILCMVVYTQVIERKYCKAVTKD